MMRPNNSQNEDDPSSFLLKGMREVLDQEYIHKADMRTIKRDPFNEIKFLVKKMKARDSSRKLLELKEESKNIRLVGINSPSRRQNVGSIYKINEKIKHL